jgi:hypothetical protein
MPQMVEKSAEGLKAVCLSILEVGGAFGYRFRTLIEFLGLTTLIVTDIDSVLPPAPPAAGQTVAEAAAGIEVEDPEDDEEEAAVPKAGSACPVSQADAVTSNQTLIQWLPNRTTIATLLAATADQRTQLPNATSAAHVHVAYQGARDVTWRGATLSLAGRTLEEAFALENLAWCQELAQKDLQLRIPRNDSKDLATVVAAIHKRVKGSGFKKTDFALALLTREPNRWVVPDYIIEGLQWLENAVAPSEITVANTITVAVPATAEPVVAGVAQ